MATNNTNKKRILIFSTAYYPFVAGAEVAVKEITDILSSDFEFDLITAGGPRDITTIALKKLLKHKVLIKMGDYISQGAEYQKYYSFLQGTK